MAEHLLGSYGVSSRGLRIFESAPLWRNLLFNERSFASDAGDIQKRCGLAARLFGDVNSNRRKMGA